MKKILGMILILTLVFGMAACGNTKTPEPNDIGDVTGGDVVDNNEPVKLGKVDYAPHGNKSFAIISVAMQGDKIVKALIDEYQFLPKADVTGVPNATDEAEGAFATNFKDPETILASKRTNAEYYTELMKSHAGSTVPLLSNYGAIEDYAVGKTVSELEGEVSGKDAEAMTEAVSGATLADTKGYLEGIIAAAKEAK